MAQTQILETDKQVTVDQAIENYKRELDATGEDLTEAVRLQRAFSVYIDTLEKGSIDFNKALRAYVSIMPPIPIPPKKPIGQLAPPPLK